MPLPLPEGIPNADSGLLNWILWGVTILIGTLATAVGALYRAAEARNGAAINELKAKVVSLETKSDEQDQKLLECETDRASLKSTCDALQREVGEVRVAISKG